MKVLVKVLVKMIVEVVRNVTSRSGFRVKLKLKRFSTSKLELNHS